MKIGIIGLPQTGKKALFEILTNQKLGEDELTSGRSIQGVAEIKDPRFDRLADLYKPEKATMARVDIVVLPTLSKEAITEGDIFSDITELDAICHVVRAFEDESVYHVDGSVSASRDIDSINSELLLHDLIFIEKRMERLDKKVKQTKEEAAAKERIILTKLKSQLDQGLPLRLMNLTPEEIKSIGSYPFVTLKNMLVVLNVSEAELKDAKLLDSLKGNYTSQGIEMMQVSAKVESEIASLDSESDRTEFLQEMGIKEPAVNLLTRLLIKTLNLLSFYTVGTDEVKQWTVRNGAFAPEAAGVIHSDLARTFIRADLMKYKDLIDLGTEDKVKDAGKAYLKGKDYLVEDGDIMSFRCGG